jgi:oxygen-independent coproporphyrinogen-3 oxidase
MELRTAYLGKTVPETLYLGGGTPSFLSIPELERVVSALHKHYAFPVGTERTLEANPEDLTPDRLGAWKALGFNRLSIGIQTFDDAVLKRIGRSHSAAQAIAGLEQVAAAGYENVSVDLILGLPGSASAHVWADLELLDRFPVSHLSVYMLGIDPGSVFEKQQAAGKLSLPAEEETVALFLHVSERLKERGFEHYEISNFARNQAYSRHNTRYWQQKPYLGLGPSAHSYDGASRQWNSSRLNTYIDSLNKGILIFEREELTCFDRYNEYVMTSLRTMWGAEWDVFKNTPGDIAPNQEERLAFYIENDWAKKEAGRFILTEAGWLVSDRIFSELFVVGDAASGGGKKE